MRLFLILLSSVLVLSSCTTSKQWKGQDTPGQFTASFGEFNGPEKHTISVRKGDVIFLQYLLAASSGSLELSLKDGSRTLWTKTVAAGYDTASIHLLVPGNGPYQLIIRGRQAAGRFDIHYNSVPPKSVTVQRNRNVELFGIMMALDDAADIFKQKDTMVFDGRRSVSAQWYAMVPRIYERYHPYDTAAIMTRYKKMETEGFFYDFFVGFLLQVDEVPQARINASTDVQSINRFSLNRNPVEARQKADSFLQVFNDFARLINLEDYISNNEAHYDQAFQQVQNNIPAGDFLPVMEAYYRKAFASYNLVPSLNLYTAMGFGTINLQQRKIYNAFGPFTFPNYDASHPDMGFNNAVKVRGLAAHEFGHSFANPAIDSLPDSVYQQTAYLFIPIKDQMKKQAYGSWGMSLNEHLVRTGEVIIAEKIGDSTRAQTILKENVDNGFIYLPFMVHYLRAWDKNPGALPFNAAVVQMMLALKAAYPASKQ